MTFCVIIEAPLKTSNCPLSKGACYWQHRESNACCYTEKELSPSEFCELTGATTPVIDVETFRDQLRAAL